MSSGNETITVKAISVGQRVQLQACILFFSGSMELSAACCERAPTLTSDYVAQGKLDKIGSVDVYIAGPESDQVILHLYDIFGFSNNNKQVCDFLAKRSGRQVIIVDLLKGGWKGEFPVKDRYMHIF